MASMAMTPTPITLSINEPMNDVGPGLVNNKLPVAELFMKRQLLMQSRENCRQLEAQLAAARRECLRLEEELYSYPTSRFQSNSDKIKTPNETDETKKAVDKVPSEIFIMIFRLYLDDPDTCHRNIRRLFLVCKYWNQIVMSTPALWSRIDVTLGGLIQEPPTKFAVTYVGACYKHSNGLLLDVKIDMGHLMPWEAYIKHLVRKHSTEIFGGTMVQKVQRWCSSLTIPPWTEEDAPNLNNASNFDIQHFIGFLVGIDGRNMERWKTLHFTLPKGDPAFAYDLLQQIAHPTPNLTRIYIGNGAAVTLRKNLQADSIPSFNDLTSLRHFTGRDGIHLDGFNILPSNIESFDTSIRMDWRNLYKISQFTSLKTLKLRKYYGEPLANRAPFRLETLPPIHLPLLRDLTLQGSFPSNMLDLLDLPSLFRLTIISNRKPLAMELPKLSGSAATPTELCWSVAIDDSSGSKWEDGSLYRFFIELLVHYQSVESIEIPVFGYASLKLALDMLRVGDRALQLPNRLILNDEDLPEFRKGDLFG